LLSSFFRFAGAGLAVDFDVCKFQVLHIPNEHRGICQGDVDVLEGEVFDGAFSNSAHLSKIMQRAGDVFQGHVGDPLAGRGSALKIEILPPARD
jgi:hypothetical protein